MIDKIHLTAAAETMRASAVRTASRPVGASFASVFDQALQDCAPVRFSAHARARLLERGIRLAAADEAQIGKAMDAAAAKGARETLLISDAYALVVSVPNRTVITAIPREELDSAVFTNIDSAVVMASQRQSVAF